MQQRRHGLIHLPGLQRHLQHLRAAIHPPHSLHTLPGLCAHNPFINPRSEIQMWSDPGSAPDQDDFSLNTEYTTFLKLLKSLSRSQKVIQNNNPGSVHPEYSLEHVCVAFFFSQQNGRLLIHKSVFVFPNARFFPNLSLLTFRQLRNATRDMLNGEKSALRICSDLFCC